MSVLTATAQAAVQANVEPVAEATGGWLQSFTAAVDAIDMRVTKEYFGRRQPRD
jgi:hypothetical protein